MRNQIALLSFFLLAALSLSAQEPFTLKKAMQSTGLHQRCGQPAARAWAMANNPDFPRKWAELENFTQNFDVDANGRAVVTLPVVVHVVYRTSTQNITDAQINSQIDVLNKDYRRLNTDASQTPSNWQGIAADVEFEFCLAGVDPNGNPTTGITRTSTNVAEIGNGSYYLSSQGGKDVWNSSKYINIWVCEIEAAGDLLGFTYPPGAVPANEDGIVMDYRYFGTTGTVSSPLDKGRTLTHEMGHYFNLEHIWGVNGGCNDDDFVSDTPDQDQEYYGCPSSGSSCGSADMYMNFLDYVDDGCMNLFTQGQKTRMLAALNGPRSSLLNTGACAATSLNPTQVQQEMVLYPNPARNQVNLQLPAALSKSMEVKLLSATGALLQTTSLPAGSTELNWALPELSSGFYLIQVNGPGGLQTRKLMLE